MIVKHVSSYKKQFG